MNEEEAVRRLLEAEATATALEPLTDEWAELDQKAAMRIQQRTLAERQRRGERLVGLKLGLTSRAKQVRMGIDVPITAFLTDAMAHPYSDGLELSGLVHPRVEPEIVFVMGKPLRGPGVTAAEALDAVKGVRAGLEVIDSRFKDFRFRLADVVADNASAARFVLGSVVRSPNELDLSTEACVVEVDGAVVDSATGAAVQGHPAEALATAANALADEGLGIEAGWIVLTGGMTDAVELHPKTVVRVDFSHLGSIVLRGLSPAGPEPEESST